MAIEENLELSEGVPMTTFKEAQMTIEEIRRNAPEGARFYRVDEGLIDYFYMTCSQSGYKWSEQANEWIRCFWFGTNPMDKLKPL